MWEVEVVSGFRIPQNPRHVSSRRVSHHSQSRLVLVSYCNLVHRRQQCAGEARMHKFWAAFALLLQPGSSFRSPINAGQRLAVSSRSSVKQRASANVTLTQTILEAIPPEEAAGGAGGAVDAPNTWQALLRADQAWSNLKAGKAPPNRGPFVVENKGPAPASADPSKDFDVVVCGGTLGVFIAAALAKRHVNTGLKPLRVAVVERAPALRGRAQEWNLSLKELKDLVELGVIDESDLTGAVEVPPGANIARSPDPTTLVASHFNLVRSGYNSHEDSPEPSGVGGFGRPINTDSPPNAGDGTGKQELRVNGILNLGVRPNVAIQAARRTLEEQGGVVMEGCGVSGIAVHDDAALLATDAYGTLKARLVVDCMGHASPVAGQARAGQTPDGVCCVVGTCASGFGPSALGQDVRLKDEARANDSGDLIYTNSDMSTKYNGGHQQYFWEAFPTGVSDALRTTYLFTYLDAREGRPSLVELFDDYWPRLKEYQGIDPDPSSNSGFVPTRALFAFFPTYRSSPLPATWDRIVHAGDASGIQSPLSFGGFGALTRHLARITGALGEALELEKHEEHSKALSAKSLSQCNPYMPNLAVTWMFQRSMSARPPPEPQPQPDFVNRLLRTNFDIMNDLGDAVNRPFLQDVVQFQGLAATLLTATARDPLFIPQILNHVGPASVFDWSRHFVALGLYTLAYQAVGHTVLEATTEHSATGEAEKAAAKAASSKNVFYNVPLARWAQGLSNGQKYAWRRRAEAWKFGAGLDYEL